MSHFPTSRTIFMHEGQRSLRVLWSFVVLCWGMIGLLSFYPFEAWRLPDEPLFDFLFYPYPYYVLPFDLVVNILAYVPYGFTLALLPRGRFAGFVVAATFGTLTSFCVELGQMFVESRIASNLDIACNALGAVVGGFLASLPMFSQLGQWLMRIRRKLFRSSWMTDYFLILLLLWFITQLDPSVPWFGVVVMPAGLPQPFVSPIENAALFLFLLEVGSLACNVLGTLLVVTLCVRRHRWRVLGALIFLLCSFLLKVSVAAFFLRTSAMWDWLEFRVLLGVLLGCLGVFACAQLSRLWRALMAVVALSGMLILEAHWPLIATDIQDLSKIRHHFGHVVNLAALADYAILIWPWMILGVMGLGVLLRIRLPFVGVWWARWEAEKARRAARLKTDLQTDWVKKHTRH